MCVCVLLPSNQNQRGGDVTEREDFSTNVNSLKHHLIVITNMYFTDVNDEGTVFISDLGT